MSASAAPIDDVLRPFQLERTHLRGRLVRLGGTLDRILGRHDYPESVSQLLGQLIVLTGALAGGLKYAGSFSVQARGDGPVSMLVADCTNDGVMRGYAMFDREAIAALEATDLQSLCGDGLLALTVDQSADGGETYQGIVELSGETLADCMLVYFRQSEQVRTGIRVAFSQHEDGRWRGGGIIVQALPEAVPEGDREAEESWRRTMILMGSVRDEELVDAELAPDRLLYRLFHEEGVRVFDPLELAAGCRCSTERVENVLESLSEDEIQEMTESDGRITVTCEFCSRVYVQEDGVVTPVEREARH